MTPGALRALAAAAAVPAPRIPLPGAYPRSLLPELDRRVAAGELSLRGVNPSVLELPAGLLVDVDTPEELAALETPGHGVVVGGTGMLAGLTSALAAHGRPVTSIARRSADLGPGVTAVRLDYRDNASLSAGLARAVEERGPVDLAVCWIHADAPEAPRTVAGVLAPGARLVQVFGTRAWPLLDVPLHVAYRQVLLGSRGGRWLTHDEISAGVLEALDADRPLTVVGEREHVSD